MGYAGAAVTTGRVARISGTIRKFFDEKIRA